MTDLRVVEVVAESEPLAEFDYGLIADSEARDWAESAAGFITHGLGSGCCAGAASRQPANGSKAATDAWRVLAMGAAGLWAEGELCQKARASGSMGKPGACSWFEPDH